MTPSGPTYDEQKADTSSVGTGIVMLGSVLIGLLLLTMVVAFIMTVYQAPHLSRLRDANVLVQLFANLVVAFYAFPAFTRTKRRAFLLIALVASGLAFVPVQSSDAQVYVGIPGIVGVGVGGYPGGYYSGYPSYSYYGNYPYGYYRPYSYYYTGPSYYWSNGHRYYRHHRHHHYYRY